MANFGRQVKKEAEISRLEGMVRALETFEVRATMMLGVYEAMAGPVDGALMQQVQEGVAGKEYATKPEFYQAVVGVARSILAEEEFRLAEAALALKEEQSPKAPHSQDMLAAAVAGLQLSSPGTVGTPEDEQVGG